ncbi:hypothetical protein ES708_18165 [subsurface metagenome]
MKEWPICTLLHGLLNNRLAKDCRGWTRSNKLILIHDPAGKVDAYSGSEAGRGKARTGRDPELRA